MLPSLRAPLFPWLGLGLLLAPSLLARPSLVFLEGTPQWKSSPQKSNEVVRHLKAIHQESFQKLAPSLTQLGWAESEITHLWGSNALVVDLAEEDLASVQALEGVARIEPVRTIPLVPFTSEPAAEAPTKVTWSVEKIGAPKVWEKLGLDGSGVVVGHIDTGVDPSHPDLQGKTLHFKDFLEKSNRTPKDGQGHGTHTAGSILGGSASGTAIGVAPGAKMVVARVFSNRGASTAALLESMQWILDPDGDPETADAPPICSNSWGSNSRTDRSFWRITEAWRAAGVLPVFAAGNAGPRAKTVGIPGGYPHVFAVGATDRSDRVARFSSRGPHSWSGSQLVKPDVSAPGHQVFSAKDGGGYWSISGTSMACPHVAGAAALIVQAHPGIPLNEIESALATTSLDLGQKGKDNDFGTGRIQIDKALESLSTLTVSGLVFNPLNDPQVADVQLGDQSMRTGRDGKFSFRVHPGTYTLRVSAFRFQTFEKTVVVKDKSRKLEVNLEKDTLATFWGKVYGPDQEPVDATITVLDTPIAPIRVGKDGAWATSLPTGDYSLEIRALGYVGQDLDIDLGSSEYFEFHLKKAKGTLLVDADGGETFEVAYEEALAERPDGIRSVSLSNLVGQNLSGYRSVVLFTGDRRVPLLARHLTKLECYLEKGGRLLLSGQNLASSLGADFLSHRLGAALKDQEVEAQEVLVEAGAGVPLESFPISSGQGGQPHATRPDSLLPQDGSVSLLRYRSRRPWNRPTAAVARRTPKSSTILLGFGLEGIQDPSQRGQVVNALLDWLEADSERSRARRGIFQEISSP